MPRACQLLEETDLSLYEIASGMGYESDLALTRTFRSVIKKHANREQKAVWR